MAHLRKGIIGNIKGKIGHVIGRNWKGIGSIQSVPVKRNNKLSVTRASNGTNLNSFAHYWHRIKVAMSMVLNTIDSSLSADYNSLVKSVLQNCRFNIAGQFTPMWSGPNNLAGYFECHDSGVDFLNGVGLSFSGQLSMYAQSSSMQAKAARYNSNSGLVGPYNVSISAATTGLFMSGLGANEGDFIIFFLWFENTTTGKRTPIYMAARVRT